MRSFSRHAPGMNIRTLEGGMCVARLITTSCAATATLRAAGSNRLASTTTAPWRTRSMRADPEPRRASTETSCPRSSSSGNTRRPMTPVAPVMKTRIVQLAPRRDATPLSAQPGAGRPSVNLNSWLNRWLAPPLEVGDGAAGPEGGELHRERVVDPLRPHRARERHGRVRPRIRDAAPRAPLRVGARLEAALEAAGRDGGGFLRQPLPVDDHRRDDPAVRRLQHRDHGRRHLLHVALRV